MLLQRVGAAVYAVYVEEGVGGRRVAGGYDVFVIVVVAFVVLLVSVLALLGGLMGVAVVGGGVALRSVQQPLDLMLQVS